jgi:hypothetical protein
MVLIPFYTALHFRDGSVTVSKSRINSQRARYFVDLLIFLGLLKSVFFFCEHNVWHEKQQSSYSPVLGTLAEE